MVVILSVLLTASLVSLVYLAQELKRYRELNDCLQHRCDDYATSTEDFIRREMYERGLRDGRTTDTLYQQFLEKVSRGEQATIMMNGMEGYEHA